MNANLPNSGEVWKIAHARKGEFTVRILSWTKKDEFFDAEIVDGRATFIAYSNKDRGGKGEVLSMRKEFVRFLSKESTTVKAK